MSGKSRLWRTGAVFYGPWVKIAGGIARGIPLSVGRGQAVRPATDRMREALFSSLGPRVEGARVLDLFAGTGAYGLEAWSRGAARVEFWERHARTMAILKGNAAAVARSLGQEVTTLGFHTGDLFSALPGGTFELILADPPYPDLNRALPRLGEIVLHCLARAPAARFCLELPGDAEPRLPGLVLLRRLGKGRGQPSMALFAWSEDAA
ncbi:MAG: RsmD family RNA methyltransferase [Opitutales bacterium]